jgi:lysyl-tRNA synthetase class 1
MRWAALGVDYEMYGKDHMPNAGLYSDICSILGSNPPVQFFYELFLNEEGNKISKSKGNSITVDEWLTYAPAESMALFMYRSPSKAKRLHFDVIPKNVDEYLAFLRKYHEESDEIKKLENPVYHIHRGIVPVIETFGIEFVSLLNLASVCNPEDSSVLWGFINKYAPEASPEKSPYLDQLVHFAIKYYNDFIKSQKQFLALDLKHRAILSRIREVLLELPHEAEASLIQQELYSIGMEAGYSDLREYFKELYQILLGQQEGPRLGSFIKLLGIDKSIELLEAKLA